MNTIIFYEHSIHYHLYFNRCYGGRQSLSARQRDRLAMSFESYSDAKSRHDQQQNQKSPVGNFLQMEWDKEGLKNEVNQYESGKTINWSELARQYQITNTAGELAKNGGQIVKEWLKSEGVDLSRFKKRKQENDDGEKRVRKRMKRGVGGEITTLCQETNGKLKEKLKQHILSGEYNVGESIVPRKVRIIGNTV